MQDQVKFLALHPKFHQAGNNFVVIQTKDNAINVCKARFDPADQKDQRTLITIPRPVAGKQKIEVLLSKTEGLVTCQVSFDEHGQPVVKKLEFPREQLS